MTAGRWRARVAAVRNAVRNTRATRHELGALTARVEAFRREVETARASTSEQMREEFAALRSDLAHRDTRQVELLKLIADEEVANRRHLEEERATAHYSEPFEVSEPVVSIPIPTYMNHTALATRALPSALAQTYENIEVVVVGDAAPPETEEVIREAGDARVRYLNRTHRGPYPQDAEQCWRVAGTMPMNEAVRLSRGHWIAPLNDDDAFRPEHVESLLELARSSRAEVVYGKLLQHHPNASSREIGVMPPERRGFGWQMAMFHRDLRFFGFQLAAALFDEPGDWSLCRRMLRAGVSFAMLDQVVTDYYPQRQWVRSEPG
jgi:hypothetical protein